MKNRLFGGNSKSKTSHADASGSSSSSNVFQSAVPAHERSSSPGYSQTSAQQHYSSNPSQSTLERSPSLRQSSGQFAPPLNQEELNQRMQAETSNRQSALYSQGQQSSAGPQPPQIQEREKRGFRDKLGFGHSSKASHGGHEPKVGRSQSVSKKRETQPPELFYRNQGATQGQVNAHSPYRRSANSSVNLLNTQIEEDEDSHVQQHNLYNDQAQRYQQPPPPPAKEPHYNAEQRYSQQPAPPQAYYSDPRSKLARVDIDGLAQQGQAGQADLRSPNAQARAFYHQEDEAAQQAQHPYYTFQSGDDEQTPGTSYQNSPEDAARHSAYGQQPPAYPQQHGRVPSGPPAHQQPELYYPRPGPGQALLDKYNRPPSQPQGPPGAAVDTRQDQQNALFLQAPQRGASLDVPPSPLATAGPPAIPQKGPLPPPSPQPPSTAESAQSSIESMPQSSRPQGTRTATGNDKTTGSRESSGMQPLPPPVPPHKQGVAAYGANVIPAGSHGAPFKGPAGAAGVLGGQKGRDSPAPREEQIAPAELVDEEAASYLQLQKENKDMREKYQKVKKYYFEMQAQVHSLQNTIAHQRLAASRTSLDDSEYIARFNRLDGLISQLAFSVRKSWKTIPDFLQRGVNKDAIATGKQEMTAVGKAYMSHWLIANLFDMYFHPSLELGLSKDLKEIWINVRRYCPPFQSGEEEEALNTKLVNWRMTTIDGLQDRLRAPDASQHYSRLVEMLNEKMVGDMSLLLTDPVPPDLAGGVSMIVELAVAVAQHIPMESRDVVVEYYYPGHALVPDMMKVETGIPALISPILYTETSPSTTDAADRASLKSTDTRDSTDPRDSTDGGAQAREEKKARGMFGGLMSGGGGGGGAKVSKTPLPSQAQVQKPPPVQSNAGRETPSKEEKVRLCVGISVQIRQKVVLSKASVYTMAL